jgi:hypothetical protein
MSDGPRQASNISRTWRPVAKLARLQATDPRELVSPLRKAVKRDFREIPHKLVDALKKRSKSNGQLDLRLNVREKCAGLAHLADGSIAGRLLLSHFAMAADAESDEGVALQVAVGRTIRERITSFAKQAEEFDLRDATTGHISRSRECIERAASLICFRDLAGELITPKPSSKYPEDNRFTGIEDGPRL